MSLGFVNQVSNYHKAASVAITQLRQFYKDVPIFLSIDGDCWDYYDLKYKHRYNVEYLYNTKKLGYPPYDKEQVLEWLKRLYIGVLKLDTDHFMMLEDDVIILNPIQYNPSVECLGHNITHGNKIPYFIQEEIERISKRKLKTDFYGNGGGSIFKSSTFIENYHKITQYFDQWWYLYKMHFYPQSGYMDCFLSIFYLLCGQDYTVNTRMYNLDPHDPEETKLIRNATIEEITDLYKDQYDIVHGVKTYYDS